MSYDDGAMPLSEDQIRGQFGLFIGVYMHRVRMGGQEVHWRPLPGHDWEWYRARVVESSLKPQRIMIATRFFSVICPCDGKPYNYEHDPQCSWHPAREVEEALRVERSGQLLGGLALDLYAEGQVGAPRLMGESDETLRARLRAVLSLRVASIDP